MGILRSHVMIPAEGSTIPACLLCASSGTEAVEALTGRQLRALWKELGFTFSSAAWGSINEDFCVRRHGCRNCGFSFFDPALAGNATFYRELEHPDYFSATRDEFARTLKFARQRSLTRVLDVGCGSGAFLDLARQAGCQTFGVELNPSAAASSRAKGHTVFDRLLQDLHKDDFGGALDLITFFQVVEHVPDPVGLLKDSVHFLNPGGYIAVAVPSSEGLGRLSRCDPHQWPPHHISWWRQADFRQLARASQLALVQTGQDRLFGSGIEHQWRLNNRLAPLVGKDRLWGGHALPGLLNFVYRMTGMKFLFRGKGTSLYAFFQAP
jgi:SAM-dependent methyltransferase